MPPHQTEVLSSTLSVFPPWPHVKELLRVSPSGMHGPSLEEVHSFVVFVLLCFGLMAPWKIVGSGQHESCLLQVQPPLLLSLLVFH